MAEFISKNKYIEDAFLVVNSQTRFAKILEIAQAPAHVIGKAGDKMGSAIFSLIEDGSDTFENLTEGSDPTSGNMSAKSVALDLTERSSKKYMVSSLATFSAADDHLKTAVGFVSNKWVQEAEAKVKAIVDSVPNSGNITHNVLTGDVVTNELVHYGDDPDSPRATLADIVSGDTITPDSIRYSVSKLRNRGIRPFNIQGRSLYVTFLDSVQMRALKSHADFKSLVAGIQEFGLSTAIWGADSFVFEGSLCIEVEDNEDSVVGASNAFAAGYVTTIGADFLAYAAIDMMEAPLTDDRVERIPLWSQAVINLAPAYTVHGDGKNVAAKTFSGYGILNPYAVHRFICFNG